MTLVFPVIFMTLMVIYWLLKIHGQSFAELVSKLISLGLPLFIGAFCLGWYNWARFSSILETGFTYQLAGPNLQEHLNELFSPVYIFQNLYNYLLNPFVANRQFPFIHPARGLVEAILSSQVLPIYLAQSITGLLFSAPFAVLAIIPITKLLKRWFKKDQLNDAREAGPAISYNWIVISFFGSFMLTFISLLTFFWSAMRYMEDFMPALMLLSVIGFFYGYRIFFQLPNKRKIYSLIGITLAGISTASGILLAISNYLSIHK